MTRRIPEELKSVARVLMAGEDVRIIGKPSIRALLVYAIAVFVSTFVLAFVTMSLFFDAAANTKAVTCLLFAAGCTGIAEFWLITTTYVLTDQRILLVSGVSNEIKDSCQLEEITGIKDFAIGNLVIISRRNGKPLPLPGVPNQSEFVSALTQPVGHG